MIIRFPIERTRPSLDPKVDMDRLEAMVQKFIDGMTGDIEKDGCTVSEEDNFDVRR